MRILVFGGSFNPVHLGHLAIVEEARVHFGYGLALLVPALNPPGKALSLDPGPEARFEMLERAIAGDPFLRADPVEIRRGGVSYTVDTLREIAARPECDGRPGLLLGTDQAAGFATWRDPDGVASLADLIVAGRAGTDAAFPWPHRELGNPLIPVSSSLIRERIAGGGPWRRLVPDGVRALIEERGWYHA